MLKPSVIIDYSKVADGELDTFSESVYNALNPNTNFTWDSTFMPSFLAADNDYRTKLEKSLNGTTSDTAAKNVSRAALLKILRVVGSEVNLQANGDIEKLKSSGLQLSKSRSKVGVLPKPTGFKVKSGDNSGDLLCSVDANPNASVYNFYSAPVPAPASITDWRLTISTMHKKNIKGFTPGKQYEVKCAYQGSEDALVYSDSILIYAQ